jgi:hypothetical protein
MIIQTMELIRRNLNVFLSNNVLVTPEPVILGNIAYATPDNPATPTDESAQIYMTLVNVEEESTLKNLPAVRQSEIRPMAYVNPALHLNIYLLFSANHQNYTRAMEDLGRILLFFQGNRIFTVSKTPVASTGLFATLEEQENNMKIILDLMSPTFEQVNHLWGSLGGKQLPFLLYKARKLEIDSEQTLQRGDPIENIQISLT